MNKRCWAGLLVVAVVAGAMVGPAEARRGRRSAARRTVEPLVPAHIVPPETPPAGPYAAALLVDAESGQILFEKDAFAPRPPASMTKMMVALIIIEAIEAGEVGFATPVTVSKEASRTGGSGVFLRANEVLPLEELFKAMMVASSNGASVAIAEALAGSTPSMIERMNRRARDLGMVETAYHTVNGLPPDRRRGGAPDITSANDQATLARKLLEHPQIFRYSAQAVVPFRNGQVMLHNTNHLVGRMEGVDGLKTGYYRLAGFNLTATAARGGMRLISVVMGCPTLRDRFRVAQQLLEWGFAHYSKLDVVQAGEPLAIEIQVKNGSQAVLHPVAAKSLTTVVRNGTRSDLHLSFQVPSVVKAPINKDQALGEIIVRDASGVVDVIRAISPVDVEGHQRGGWLSLSD